MEQENRPKPVIIGSRQSLLLGHAVALVMVAVSFSFGCSGFLTEWEYWTKGVVSNATVTRKEITVAPQSRPGVPPSKNYAVWYRYQSQGQEHEGRGNVVEQFWNHLQEGHAIEISYLREDPSTSRPVGRPFTDRYIWLILLATGSFIVVAFTGLWVLAGWKWWVRYKARALPPQPPTDG